jgi:hypothetical protein
MLAQVRAMCLNNRFPTAELPVVEVFSAYERARDGDRDGGLLQMRKSLDDLFNNGQYMYVIGATALLVEALIDRACEDDAAEAEAAVYRLAAIPGNEWVARDIMVLRLRTMLAKARGDEAGYLNNRDSYRTLAAALGFEGHQQWAAEMP